MRTHYTPCCIHLLPLPTIRGHYPHTNDSLLAVGIFIDDMTSENGPLQIIPTSHTGKLNIYYDYYYPNQPHRQVTQIINHYY